MKHRGSITKMITTDRPLGPRVSWPIEQEAQAILRTAVTGKAVRLEFKTAEDLRLIRMALRHALLQRKAKLHAQRQGDALICWADRVAG